MYSWLVKPAVLQTPVFMAGAALHLVAFGWLAESDARKLKSMKAGRGPAHLGAVLATAMLSGCVHEPAPLPQAADQVRVDVTDVVYDHSTGTHYLVLEEKSRRRVLPIAIGDDEARAIMFELRGIKPERPLTYELLLTLIERTGNKVDRVAINDVRDEVYYATVYLDRGRYSLDSRPSDAIALAIGASAPIFVSDKLLQAATPETSAPPINTTKGLGLTLQDLTPELARYFAVDTNSGLLIADIETNAHNAGIQRGDILTELDGHPIRTLDQFNHLAAAALSGGDSKVTLTLKRGNTVHLVTLNVRQTSSHP